MNSETSPPPDRRLTRTDRIPGPCIITVPLGTLSTNGQSLITTLNDKSSPERAHPTWQSITGGRAVTLTTEQEVELDLLEARMAALVRPAPANQL